MISKEFFASDDWVLWFYVGGNCISNYGSEIIFTDFIVCSKIFYLNVVYDEIAMDSDITRNYLVRLREEITKLMSK